MKENLLCKLIGHEYDRKKWAGARGGYFGALMKIVQKCERCGHEFVEWRTINREEQAR